MRLPRVAVLKRALSLGGRSSLAAASGLGVSLEDGGDIRVVRIGENPQICILSTGCFVIFFEDESEIGCPSARTTSPIRLSGTPYASGYL